MSGRNPIRAGWEVHSNDGHQIGSVSDVGEDFFRVRESGFFGHDLYIPATSVATLRGEVVYLNLSRDEIGSTGWESQPTESRRETENGDEPKPLA